MIPFRATASVRSGSLLRIGLCVCGGDGRVMPALLVSLHVPLDEHARRLCVSRSGNALISSGAGVLSADMSEEEQMATSET